MVGFPIQVGHNLKTMRDIDIFGDNLWATIRH